MKICLLDDQEWNQLLPLTYTRSVADVRIGILTIREKWEKFTGGQVLVHAPGYLGLKYDEHPGEYALMVNSAVLPNEELLKALSELKSGEELVSEKGFVARIGSKAEKTITYSGKELRISYAWDIFSLNKYSLADDFALLTKGRQSQKISSSNTIVGTGEIFLEEGAKVEASILNASEGPIYLGKNAEIMEGSMVRGGLALCEGASLKLGTKIYGATTIGPHCKVGGEVNNSVIFGFSNKAHDGFLGNSVIGEWCNLGADTNNSNLKNNYGIVKVFSEEKVAYISTGLQFCGLIMGDHSKCGINTMLNTGTVAGVNANIFGGGFPPKHVPSFSWGGADGFEVFDIDKSFEVSERVMSRRNVPFTESDREIMRHIFKLTAKFRG